MYSWIQLFLFRTKNRLLEDHVVDLGGQNEEYVLRAQLLRIHAQPVLRRRDDCVPDLQRQAAFASWYSEKF
jgi:hypothetical protein